MRTDGQGGQSHQPHGEECLDDDLANSINIIMIMMIGIIKKTEAQSLHLDQVNYSKGALLLLKTPRLTGAFRLSHFDA